MVRLIQYLIRRLHFVILLVAIYGLYEKFSFHNDEVDRLFQRKQQIESRIVKVKKRLGQIKKFNSDLVNIKTRIDSVIQRIETVQRQLPNKISDPELLDLFSKDANLLRLKDVYLTPSGERSQSFYYARSYEMKALGTFQQALVFLEKMSKKDRIINIKFLEIESSKKRQRGRFHLVDMTAVMEVFRYNENYQERKSIKEMQEEDLATVTLSDKSYLMKLKESGKNQEAKKENGVKENKATKAKKKKNSS